MMSSALHPGEQWMITMKQKILDKRAARAKRDSESDSDSDSDSDKTKSKKTPTIKRARRNRIDFESFVKNKYDNKANTKAQ